MLPLNPYIAGNPVHGQEQFVGRADVLREVEKVLRNPSTNAIVLFGQRRIGKTSILLQITQALKAKHEFLPIYFDLQDKASLPLAKVLYQIAQNIAQITKTALPNRKKFDPEGRFFRETFIPQAVETSQHQGLVLLLDEFDVLDMPQHERAGVTFFPYLREWMRVATGIQLVFVLGRRPEELSTDTLATFKGLPAYRVSLMKREDAEAIIRQSERNQSLRWNDEAVEQVWYWTQGHPYFTQLLCSEIWESVLAFDDFDGFDTEETGETVKELPVVRGSEVEAAIDGALEQGANALQWIWNGLPPAERIVMAAMAETEEDHITQQNLTDVLNRSKVRLILRDLELAPETLISWDLLRKENGESYRFAIPLLRRWVQVEKPLRRVKANLDSLEPLAESLYQSAEGFSKIENLDETERLLRNALDVNPYHFRARLLLGKVLLAKGNPADAVEELQPAYEFDPRSSKTRFIGALLALADTQEDEEQVATYDKVLELEPDQPVALEKKRALRRRQAGAALEKGELDTALHLYQAIDDQEGIRQIETIRQKQALDKQLRLVQQHEHEEDWTAAIDVYQQLLTEFPDTENWQERLEIARLQKHLAELYTRGITALNQGNAELAQDLFGEIIGIQPDYKDAWRYLGIALKKVDVEKILQQNRQYEADIQTLKHQLMQKSTHKPSRLLTGMLITALVSIIVLSAVLAILFYDKVRNESPLEMLTPTPAATPADQPAPPQTPQEEPEVYTDPHTGIEFVRIQGGCFQMGCLAGSVECAEDEIPVHEVCLDGFRIGKYEVTQGQWFDVMGENPSYFNQEKIGNAWRDHPVEQVSWNDAQEFLKKLNEQAGQEVYRLPAEAEWEYAARAGSAGIYSFEDNVNSLQEYAWYQENSDDQTHPAGQLKPNVWGLYDMHGNVWEWCADVYVSDIYAQHQQQGTVQNPCAQCAESSSGVTRVIRGGSGINDAWSVCSVHRSDFSPADRNRFIGLRLVKSE